MSSSAKILLSRHALQSVKPKYPIHFTFPKKKFKTSAETPWPVSLQIAGYTAAVLAIPYSFSVVVSESGVIRDSLEGEYQKGTTNDGNGAVTTAESWGRKIVSLVRWYWGINDHIPYIEVMERKEDKEGSCSEVEYSLENENNAVLRLNQDRIEKESNDDVKVVLESEGIIVQDGLILKGNASISDQLFSGNASVTLDKNRPIIVTIQDKDSGDDSTSMNDDKLKMEDAIPSFEEGNSTKKEISRLSTIYAMWNYFPPSKTSTNRQVSISSPSSSGSMNTIQIRIEELQHEIADLQKLLKDPMCTRDRDDMDKEIRELRSEMNMLKREKRKANLKKLIPFS